MPFKTLQLGLCLLAAALSLGLAGCTYERVVSDSWDNLRSIAGQSGEQARASSNVRSTLNQTSWAILMATYGGDSARDLAQAAIKELRRDEQVPDLWVRHEEDKVLLYRGQYVSRDEPQAQADLRQTQLLKLKGKRPFKEATLVQVGGRPAEQGTGDPLDLRPHTGSYTLQIAFFDAAGGDNFRQAAEQYTRNLRQDKVDAYFYHGPHLSLVTVGLFTENDFELKGTTWVYGPRIRELRERFPHNIGNGATVIEKMAGKEIGVQSSFLVRVP